MSWTNRIGLLILVIAFAASLYKTSTLGGPKTDEKGRDYIELGLGHWHLEGGWREGFDTFFREYEAMKAQEDVPIKMVDIPRTGVQSLYHLWVTSQLLGGTAPALISIGREPDEFIPRYYVPLDPYIRQPNPYNKGTDLEGVPWRDTFQDNMQGSYNSKFLAYYGIPLSVLVYRVYYNVDLYNEILHSFTPDQLTDAADLVRLLKSGSRPDAPRPLQRIWVLLEKIRVGARDDTAPIDGRVALDRLAGTDRFSRAETTLLVAVLNALLRRDDLYNADTFGNQAFPSMPSERKVKHLLELQALPAEPGNQPGKMGLKPFRQCHVIMLNRLLLEAVLGELVVESNVSEPTDFDQWIAVCRRIQRWASLETNRDRAIYPIAAIGKWTSSVLVNQYITSTTANIMRRLDVNRNGRTGTGFGIAKTEVEPEETYFATAMGRVKMKNEYVVAAYRMIEEVRKYFQPGFVAYGWDDGKFQFGQGYAVMMPTGAWETKSLMKAAAEANPPFEIGAFPFPIPAPSHPQFGKFVAGPVTEVGIPSGGDIGVYRGVSEEQRKYAIDFLRWFTSRRVNERFMNEYTYWTPAIRGARIEDHLKPFAPMREGYRGGQAMQIGPKTSEEYGKLMSRWLAAEMELDTFLDKYVKEYPGKARDDIKRQIVEPLRRRISQIERELHRAQTDGAGLSGLDPEFNPLSRESLVLENQLNTIYDFSWMRAQIEDE